MEGVHRPLQDSFLQYPVCEAHNNLSLLLEVFGGKGLIVGSCCVVEMLLFALLSCWGGMSVVVFD
jgi:hypothetical protein